MLVLRVSCGADILNYVQYISFSLFLVGCMHGIVRALGFENIFAGKQ